MVTPKTPRDELYSPQHTAHKNLEVGATKRPRNQPQVGSGWFLKESRGRRDSALQRPQHTARGHARRTPPESPTEGAVPGGAAVALLAFLLRSRGADESR
jgi:hypothetical protein